MKDQYIRSQDLELITHLQPGKQIKSSFTSKINQLWNKFFRFLSTPDEPKIWLSRNKYGSAYWEIYDPLSRRRVCFDSESEVRAWLERYYY